MCQLLPRVNDLPSFPELPVTINMLSSDLSSWSHFTQDLELIRILFTPNDLAPCTQFKDHVMELILRPVAFDLTTAASFISLWDSLIGNLIEFVFENGKITRDWSHSSSRKLRRSAFRLIWQEINVLRGEELASSEDMMLGRRRLCGQMRWTFSDQVPYLFGCVTSGAKLDLLALIRSADDLNLEADQTVTNILLTSFDLSQWRDKFRLILAMLNMARLFNYLADVCPRIAENEYTAYERGDGVVLRMDPQDHSEGLFQDGPVPDSSAALDHGRWRVDLTSRASCGNAGGNGQIDATF